jgi:uncharacterized membrane protein YozB (DUF420 family)
MTWDYVLKDIIDKMFVGLIVAGVTWLINKGLEKHKMRFAYRQKLAARTLQAYWEIVSVLQDQAFKIEGFIQVARQLLETHTESARVKMSNAWDEFSSAYKSEQPKLLTNSLFVSDDVADRLTAHQKLVKDFSVGVNPFTEASVERVSTFTDAMVKSLAKLQSQMMDEIQNPPLLDK